MHRVTTVRSLAIDDEEFRRSMQNGQRPSTIWIVASLFVFGMLATYLFVTTSGLVRVPTGAAMAMAPWFSHLCLTQLRPVE
jgi:hypothetical protein